MAKLSPRAIHEYIDRFVVGQEEAKRTVSNTLFLHAIRTIKYYNDSHEYEEAESTIKAPNTMLIGPSGCGKTYIVQKGIEALQTITGMAMWPLVVIDAGNITPAGYVGHSLEDLLANYYFNVLPAKVDKSQIEIAFATAVVFIDEIDKLCGGGNASLADFTRHTQYSLLKLVEGTDAVLEQGTGRSSHTVSTNNMMFMFAGNFPQVRAKRDFDTKPSIGFVNGNTKTPEQELDVELQKAGMATQLVGRIANIAEIRRLDKKALKRILTDTEGSPVEKYKELMEEFEIDLEISDYHMNKIVNDCFKKKTGARGLQAALDKFMQKLIYDLEISI